MDTPGPNHPAWRGIGKRTEGQFDNVYSLSAARVIKQVTGKGAAVRVKPDSPSMTKHEDEALGIHKD